MFLTTDFPNSDPQYVTAISEDGDDNFQLFDYVSIGFKARKWIGQIVEPNINISLIGSPYDPSILHGIKRLQEDNDVQIAEHTKSWKIYLLGEYDNNLSTLRQRPSPGSTVKKLNREDTIKVLNLPQLVKRQDETTNTIGYLLNADNVPLCVAKDILTHHILVSGGTGSGKSNTCANIIHQAVKLGFTVFLYDAKPDYRLISSANSDPATAYLWNYLKQYGLKPANASSLTRIGFYKGENHDYSAYDHVLGFKASDFNPYIFAGIFFDTGSAINQYDEFAAICAGMSKNSFTLEEIMAEVQKKLKEGKINEQTGKTIVYKVNRRRSFMPWLDAVGKRIGSQSRNPFDRESSVKQVTSFKSADFIGTPSIVHIDCAGLDGEEYALFLSRFMSECQNVQRKNKGKHGVVQFVDEAHRIFDNESRYKGSLASIFNRVMREGRSQKHGVVLSLQNASQVPDIVMNNFNSVIVMKQNNREVARAATQTMGKEFADQSMTLSRGHALVKMFESSATVIAQMAPSPFELERSERDV